LDAGELFRLNGLEELDAFGDYCIEIAFVFLVRVGGSHCRGGGEGGEERRRGGGLARRRDEEGKKRRRGESSRGHMHIACGSFRFWTEVGFSKAYLLWDLAWGSSRGP